MLIGKFGDGQFKDLKGDLDSLKFESLDGLVEVYKVSKIYKVHASLVETKRPGDQNIP